MAEEAEEIPGQVVLDPAKLVTSQPRKADEAAQAGDVGGGGGGDDDDGEMPLGLRELSKTDKIVVEQKAQYSEACCGYEGENNFDVTDAFGQVILRAHEESNCCARQCCDQLRPFDMEIKDKEEKTVITIRRPFRCNNCLLCPCLTQRLSVESPPGTEVGAVDQNISVFAPSFDIFDADGDKIYKIEGPSSIKNRCRSCWCGCCPLSFQLCCGCGLRDINFKVLRAKGGQQVGTITKKCQPPGIQASSLASEMDRFGLDFPDDADVRVKALLTAATFLIDFLYFEGGEDDLDGDDD